MVRRIEHILYFDSQFLAFLVAVNEVKAWIYSADIESRIEKATFYRDKDDCWVVKIVCSVEE